MIPKTIHYCWFGGNPKPKLTQKCINSWEKYCPDYTIIEWNEDNYNLDEAPLYVRQAYEQKKWAFVTDYVRLQVVYENGGIYFDTDVELVKCPDALLNKSAYFGFEGVDYINTGLGFGAEKGSQILLELMQDYADIPFVLKDGRFDLTPCTYRNTEIFARRGMRIDGTQQVLEGNIAVLPAEYLCPVDNATRILNRTENTISIHHFDASWQSAKERRAHDKLAKKRRLKLRIEQILYFPRWMARKIIGNDRYERIKRAIKRV